MKTVFSRVHINRKQLTVMIVLVLVASVLQMVSPGLVSYMINNGVGENKKSLIIILAVAMLVLSVLACVFQIISSNISAKITAKFSADLRHEVYHKVQMLSAAEIDKFGTASLISRSTTDVTTIQGFLSMMLRIGFMAPTMMVAGLVLSIATSGKVALVLAVAIPVLIIGATTLIIASSRYSVKLRVKIDEINQLFMEALEGVGVIRAFNKQKHEMDRFDVTNTESANLSGKSVTLSNAMTPMVNSLFGLTGVAAMVIGTGLVMAGSLEVGTLVSATAYISTILVGIMMAAVVISQFPDAYACMNRIGEVLETEISINDSRKKMPEKTCKGTVEFKNVTFSYPGADEAVIKGISFISRPGETTAIIGRTGCGKSTLLNLISGYIAPTKGKIMIDGTDVTKYSEKEWAAFRLEHFGFIFQSFQLIPSLTTFENIELPLTLKGVHPSERKQRVNEMLHRVGLENHAGHYPNELSGGQQQRVSIARALILNPSIILADEPTGSLDSETEQEILEFIRQLNRERGITFVIITHDDEVASIANTKFHLSDGVLEKGEETVEV